MATAESGRSLLMVRDPWRREWEACSFLRAPGRGGGGGVGTCRQESEEEFAVRAKLARMVLEGWLLRKRRRQVRRVCVVLSNKQRLDCMVKVSPTRVSMQLFKH